MILAVMLPLHQSPLFPLYQTQKNLVAYGGTCFQLYRVILLFRMRWTLCLNLKPLRIEVWTLNEVELYKNMKRWLFLYGSQLLDLMFPITNPVSKDPLKRYDNLSRLFDSQFNLLGYYSSQVGSTLPILLVHFVDRSGTDCFKTYEVNFNIYFQTISPRDCKDNSYIICNTPECILEYRQQMFYALCEMVYNMASDMRHLDFDGEPWGYPVNYDVISESMGELYGSDKDEILHFKISYVLTDNISCC